MGPRICRFVGSGTEQVERVVAETLPKARLARMDVDTTSGKWSHHEILGRVERGEVDILLGTQMIAKGLDFPWRDAGGGRERGCWEFTCPISVQRSERFNC